MAMTIMLFISGMILICAIMKIRMTFKQQESELDVSMMVLHSTSVGLFLISLVAYSIVLLVENEQNPEKRSMVVTRGSEAVEDFFGWLANMILGFILL